MVSVGRSTELVTVPRALVLVVENEESVRRSLHQTLTATHYQVHLAASGEEALHQVGSHPPDVVLLDIALPGMSGLNTCRALRQCLTVPILVLSNATCELTKIAVFDLGADDYVLKPYAIRELLARIHAKLRRMQSGPVRPSSVSYGELFIEPAQRRVSVAGIDVHLTPTEYAILMLLICHADCVVTSQQILEHVWDSKYEADLRSLRVHMSHLRRKLSPSRGSRQYIQTAHCVGFRFLGTDG